MPRGNGQAAQTAKSSGRLDAFVKPKGAADGLGTEHEYVDWSEIDPRLVAGAVWAVNKEGGSLLLGHSRDKSSYSIRVYSGSEGTSYYFACNPRGVEELCEFLDKLVALGDMDLGTP